MKLALQKYCRCFALFMLIFGFSSITSLKAAKGRHPAPIPNFYVTGLCLGDSTHFINTTQLGTYYTWTIDGSNGQHGNPGTIYTSQDQDISFLFPSAGTYTVTLVADNGHVVQLVRAITIDSVAKADFDFIACQYQFVNLSSCSDSVLWDFGDGTFSNLNTPSHNYNNLGGNFNVKLTAFGTNSIDTLTKLINVPANNLKAKFTSYFANDSIYFNALDTTFGFNIQYHWAFGDGTNADLFSTSQHRVAHHYAVEDTSYTVFLLTRTVCNQAYTQSDVLIPSSKNYNGVWLYPNPITDGIVHIRTEWHESLSSVTLINSIGQEISFQLPITRAQGFDLNVSTLPKGVYLMQLLFGNDRVVRKILLD